MAQNTLQERIRSDMNLARRDQDKHRARLLSTLLADIHNRQIELGRELNDLDVVQVLSRSVKMHVEAAEQMASRPERAERERSEAAVLRSYMPPQLSEQEIREKVIEAIEAGTSEIGAVMGRVMPQLKGRAEGREVNRIVREELESRRSGA